MSDNARGMKQAAGQREGRCRARLLPKFEHHEFDRDIHGVGYASKYL